MSEVIKDTERRAPTVVTMAQRDAEKHIARMQELRSQILSSDDMRKSIRMLGVVTAPMFRATDSLRAIYAPMERMNEALTQFAKAATSRMEPLIHFQKQMDSMLDNHKRLAGSMQTAVISPNLFKEREPIHYVPAVESRNVNVRLELNENHFQIIAGRFADTLIERGVTMHVHTTSAQIDLLYDVRKRTLTRHIGTLECTARFDDGENNKRRDLFKKLCRARRDVPTGELKEYLGCPNTDATYKVIQGLNKKMSDELKLTMNIVDGSGKGGYRINSRIAIHEV